jgi:hypothetical protein
MTFFSSRVIGRTAAAECGVVAAVAIGFPSIFASPGDPGSWPQALLLKICKDLSRGIMAAKSDQESYAMEG